MCNIYSMLFIRSLQNKLGKINNIVTAVIPSTIDSGLEQGTANPEAGV